MLQAQSHRSHLVATTLAGAWRESIPANPGLSESQLDEVTPLLYGSGAAALGWWRIRNSQLSATACAEVLQQTFRLQVLQAAIHEEKLKKVFSLLRAASIEPLVVKGWAAAALYPQTGLRPCGDIDICVRSEHFDLAREVLNSPAASDCWVDLHRGFTELKGRSLNQLFERSKLVIVGDETIRVLAAEDHLALLAIHFLKHGGWRPLWLCDVGAAIESLPSEFNWEICLGADSTRARWIRSAIGLAHRLLGARLELVPFANRTRQLPRWLVAAVLKQWESPFPANQPPLSHPVPMVKYFVSPRGILNGLRARWPDPILATVSVNGGFNKLPRFPYQLANCVARIMKLIGPTP